MAWDTIHDYISDPAGFEAHHRQFKAQGGNISHASLVGPLDGGTAGGRVSSLPLLEIPVEGMRDLGVYKIAHIEALKAVADAAWAVRHIVEPSGDCPPWEVSLFDALDALDGLG